MITLTPLETFFDRQNGRELPLPDELAFLFGPLQFPFSAGSDQSYVISNFVTSLDGVVSLNTPGHASGGDISGFNRHDQMVMGLLRAIADIIIIGAGTLRAEPDHRWTADYIFPALSNEYNKLRKSLGKQDPPLNTIITGSGALDFGLPIFQSGEVPVLIITTELGLQQILKQILPPSVQVQVEQNTGHLSARTILNVANTVRQSSMILVEAGPQLMSDFLVEKCVNELFLTLAPQIAGRANSDDRPGLISRNLFAPEDPLWTDLISVKRGDNHLFLRYRFKW